jgi:hypothetical protein
MPFVGKLPCRTPGAQTARAEEDDAPIRAERKLISRIVARATISGNGASGSGAPSKRNCETRQLEKSTERITPSGEGAWPSRIESAICACIAPRVATAGPMTPALAQVAATGGGSVKTARRLGAPPQKPPA